MNNGNVFGIIVPRRTFRLVNRGVSQFRPVSYLTPGFGFSMPVFKGSPDVSALTRARFTALSTDRLIKLRTTLDRKSKGSDTIDYEEKTEVL